MGQLSTQIVNTTSVLAGGGATGDLIAYTLPAKTLTTNLQGVRIRAWGQISGYNQATNDVTVALYFGATQVGLIDAKNLLSSNAPVGFIILADVIRTAAATETSCSYGVAGPLAGTTVRGVTVVQASPAEDTTANIVIKGNAYQNAGPGAIVQMGMIVETF